jgi:hypothetical protein
MVDAPSDYVGTEKKIDLIGRFNCIVETKVEEKTENGTTSKQKTVTLTVPNGYHFKEGFMASLESSTKPDLKLTELVGKYTSHSVFKCESWK